MLIRILAALFFLFCSLSAPFFAYAPHLMLHLPGWQVVALGCYFAAFVACLMALGFAQITIKGVA